MGRQPNKPRPRSLQPSIYFRKRGDGSGAYHFYYIDPVDKHQRSIKVADVPKGKERDPAVIVAANAGADSKREELRTKGKVAKPTQLTVPEAWDRFLTRKGNRNPRRDELKHSTRQDYASQWKNYLEPKLGKLKVSELAQWRIDEFVEWLDDLVFDGTREELSAANAALRTPIVEANRRIRKENAKLANAGNRTKPPKKLPQPWLSRKRRDNIIITLRGLLTFCVEEGWLEDNLGDNLRWKGYVKRAFPIPTYAETVQLLRVIDPFFAPFVEMGLYSGCRAGELLAAEWSWVDWGHKRLNVSGSYTHGKLNDTTKSGENRVVPLPDRIMKTLTKWKKVCPSGTIMFPSKAGNRMSLDTFRQRTWNPAVAAIGRPELSPNCLRHTYITWVVRQAALGSGATTLAIAKVSGHKQLSSVNFYVEVWDEQLEAIAKGFNESKEDIKFRLLGLDNGQLPSGSDGFLAKLAETERQNRKPPPERKPKPKPSGHGIVIVKDDTKR